MYIQKLTKYINIDYKYTLLYIIDKHIFEIDRSHSIFFILKDDMSQINISL